MAIDWTTVKIEHVKQACKQYDSGPISSQRQAKSTFLILDGRTYPAKFIRGLAYRMANGVDLDPSTDYSGGKETARFFSKLGLQTMDHELPKQDIPLVEVTPPVIRKQSRRIGPRTYEAQKQALFNLLRQKFGTVDTEVAFPWLVVPDVGHLDGALGLIWSSLKDMRGHSNFATPGRRLCCDFVIRDKKLIIEYDERQHFTRQRARSLQSYPPELRFGFDQGEWITACESIHANDPDPIYRDEQRAFYDSLRDLLSLQHGYRLVRVRLWGSGLDGCQRSN